MLAKALDRGHLALAYEVDERDARVDGHTVEEHRAGAAVPLGTGDFRPGQSEVLAQRFGKGPPDRALD